MEKSIVWQGLHHNTEEHCNVNFLNDGIVVRSEIEGWAGTTAIYAEYMLQLASDWTVQRIDIRFTTGSKEQHYGLVRTSMGWVDTWGADTSHCGDCVFVDISLSPFTNTLVLNGLDFNDGERKRISVLYFDVLANTITQEVQYYTRLSTDTYRFETEDGSFKADITIDADGFVTQYPQLFKMLIPH